MMDVMVISTIASIENILPFCLKHFRTVKLPVGEHAGVLNVTGTYVGDNVGLVVGLVVGSRVGLRDVDEDDGVDVGLREVGKELGFSDVGEDDGVKVGADDVGKDVVEGYDVVVGKVEGNEL